ncbi:ABC transporter substrate-binding protein [Alkalihalobacillus sp. LMS39]|uniref:ABC transporter substrate-binding protein n=1 Tax=Alkalihalobacillus sp. LMS39 TaxID=2924032 RepID=UPI001FB2B528|nr:ABC transporter substrate-binding protein [Alkalihalobacillus sp. LMS39]UOE94065.1 ABC transporter substrate-binding protein [Alkalihalobacillus sp. LMS39]
MLKVITRKSTALLLGVSVLALSLAACGNGEAKSEQTPETDTEQTPTEEVQEEASTRVLTDAMGHEVVVPANPERVIASYLEDHLVALGIKPAAQWSISDGQGVQDYLQYELKDVPTIPYDLPFEAVMEMNPDLIIVDSASMVEDGKYEQYNKIAPTYVIGLEVNNDWRDELVRVGQVFGKEDLANEVLAEYDTKAAEAKASIESEVGTPSVAAVWLVGGKFFMVAETVSSGAVLYGDLGLEIPSVVKEVSENATGNWNEISLEKLAELDADHLFLINSDTGVETTPLSESLWEANPAVKAGNVHEFSPSESWLYTGPIANSQIIDHVVESLVK